jgi:4-alpha-glucanotransferase
MVDIVRIDHFNGFVKYWEIPIDAETAKPGEWIKGPNEHLLRKIHQAFHDKIIIAEDLGEANELAKVLREKYNIPGMEIVQFTLEEALEKEISPTFEQYPRNSVVYTGTHDNDTIIGWYDRFALAEKNDIKLSILQENFGDNRDDFHWKMISFAYNSDAKIVIVPLQDILGLDSSARMNTPGTIKGNWRWRFTEKMLTHSMIKQMKELTLSTNRITF